MQADAQGQVSGSAAEIYEAIFVPALFAEWAPWLADAAGLAPGDRVLDVACGTGSAAREALRRTAPGGQVIGLDRNPGMLAVAGRLLPEVTFRQGRAEALGEPSGSYDAVLCQFGLMFFEDRRQALAEMWRVLRPGGRLALVVWDALERTPGYAAVTELLAELFGQQAAQELQAPFCLGEPAILGALLAEAGIPNAAIERIVGTARFPSIATWVEADIKGWTLAERIDDAGYKHLQALAATRLARFVGPDGRVSFDSPALIVRAIKP